ncbi:type IV toxin-antitoxin system AbiEi family antitoxin domain-containing protein [Streptomyces erythrochromogenes]|uniref:type IV toxin-antitoxin system AbiEi family antitoxin domain-containing protein n=1 Tax=Streptomyces erythrochromogenes TaxID=285574 RepID=UPI003437F0FE
MDRSEAIRRLGVIAADQWGLVTARQAQAAGLSRVDLTRLIDADLLQRAVHGVYQLPGGTPTPHLDIKAAWLRLDPGAPAWERPLTGDRAAVVSHASACQLYDIGDIPADHVEISVPRRRTTREPGVILRKAAIDAADVTLVDGLPVTTVDRTICDLLVSRADGGHIGRVLADADQRGLTDTRVLAERVQPYRRAYGLPKNASGSDLLNLLAEQAGFTLRDEQLTTAGARAAINSAIQEAVVAHGTASPGRAAVYEAARAAGSRHYAIGDQSAAHALVHAPGEGLRRALENIARQSPGRAYLEAMRSVGSLSALENTVLAQWIADSSAQLAVGRLAELMNNIAPAAHIAALSETTALAQRLAQAVSDSPAQLAVGRVAELINGNVLAERLAELALPLPDIDLPLEPGAEDAQEPTPSDGPD